MRQFNLCAACLLLAAGTLAQDAQDEAAGPITLEEAADYVLQMSEETRPAWEIVAFLVEEGGMTVAGATYVTVANADSPSMRSYATFAGMCLAPERKERSEDVGDSAVAVIEDESEQARVAGEVIAFEPERCDELRPRRPPSGLKFGGGPGIVTPGDIVDPSPSG
jgi:hypothetical protein